jgi:hypothetical protein
MASEMASERAGAYRSTKPTSASELARARASLPGDDVLGGVPGRGRARPTFSPRGAASPGSASWQQAWHRPREGGKQLKNPRARHSSTPRVAVARIVTEERTSRRRVAASRRQTDEAPTKHSPREKRERRGTAPRPPPRSSRP